MYSTNIWVDLFAEYYRCEQPRNRKQFQKSLIATWRWHRAQIAELLINLRQIIHCLVSHLIWESTSIYSVFGWNYFVYSSAIGKAHLNCIWSFWVAGGVLGFQLVLCHVYEFHWMRQSICRTKGDKTMIKSALNHGDNSSKFVTFINCKWYNNNVPYTCPPWFMAVISGGDNVFSWSNFARLSLVNVLNVESHS